MRKIPSRRIFPLRTLPSPRSRSFLPIESGKTHITRVTDTAELAPVIVTFALPVPSDRHWQRFVGTFYPNVHLLYLSTTSVRFRLFALFWPSTTTTIRPAYRPDTHAVHPQSYPESLSLGCQIPTNNGTVGYVWIKYVTNR